MVSSYCSKFVLKTHYIKRNNLYSILISSCIAFNFGELNKSLFSGQIFLRANLRILLLTI